MVRASNPCPGLRRQHSRWRATGPKMSSCPFVRCPTPATPKSQGTNRYHQDRHSESILRPWHCSRLFDQALSWERGCLTRLPRTGAIDGGAKVVPDWLKTPPSAACGLACGHGRAGQGGWRQSISIVGDAASVAALGCRWRRWQRRLRDQRTRDVRKNRECADPVQG